MTASLQRLLTWMSPAFPVGAFAWSAGLETAIVSGRVTDRASTEDWIGGALLHGGLHTDGIFVAQASRHWDSKEALADLTDLALALTPARERWQETTITGQAFVLAAAAWPAPAPAPLPQPCPYPIAVGAIAGSHGIGVEDTVVAFLTTALHSQVSVAVRLVPIGQSDGLATMAALEPEVARLARHCAAAGTEAIGTIAYGADIAQMKHETLPTRIFRS